MRRNNIEIERQINSRRRVLTSLSISVCLSHSRQLLLMSEELLLEIDKTKSKLTLKNFR